MSVLIHRRYCHRRDRSPKPLVIGGIVSGGSVAGVSRARWHRLLKPSSSAKSIRFTEGSALRRHQCVLPQRTRLMARPYIARATSETGATTAAMIVAIVPETPAEMRPFLMPSLSPSLVFETHIL